MHADEFSNKYIHMWNMLVKRTYLYATRLVSHENCVSQKLYFNQGVIILEPILELPPWLLIGNHKELSASGLFVPIFQSSTWAN